MKTILKIEKEQIRDLVFCKRDVLDDEAARKKRNFDLMRAQALGNLIQAKVSITFECEDKKIYQVNTTVWAVGKDFILLKGNTHIPIRTIHEVD